MTIIQIDESDLTQKLDRLCQDGNAYMFSNILQKSPVEFAAYLAEQLNGVEDTQLYEKLKPLCLPQVPALSSIPRPMRDIFVGDVWTCLVPDDSEDE